MNKISWSELNRIERQVIESGATINEKETVLHDAHNALEMRLDDIINHLTSIRAEKGNIRCLRGDLNAGTMRPSDFHVQQRGDAEPGEWIFTVY